MKNLKKLSREELKKIDGGFSKSELPVDGAGCSADSSCSSGCRGLASNGDHVCSSCCIA